MRVQTATLLEAPPSVVWPLLCSSRMDPRVPVLFRFGIPKPVECRLPQGGGGVGAHRQCVSDRGVINQRILAWEPTNHLAFEMRDTDLYFGRCVHTIHEDFGLEPAAKGTRLVRTTTFHVAGPFGVIKAPVVWFGLKNVHRYVFANWRRLARAATSDGLLQEP